VACRVLVTSFLTHYSPLASFQTLEQSVRYLVTSNSNTSNSNPADTILRTKRPSSLLSNIPCRHTSATGDGIVRISTELTVDRRMCVTDYDGLARLGQASGSSQFCNQTHSNYPNYIAGFVILAVLQLRVTILWVMTIPSQGSRVPTLRGNVLSYLSRDDKSLKNSFRTCCPMKMT
jgi:hypothetical protein